MEQHIIAIGNSRGIILSEEILTRYNISDTVELISEKDFIIIKPKSTPRKGWGRAFRIMHNRGDDKLFFDDVFNDDNL